MEQQDEQRAQPPVPEKSGGSAWADFEPAMPDLAPVRRRARRVAAAAVLVVVLLAIALALLIVSAGQHAASPYDDAAREGQAPYKSQEEMQAELDRVVDEGMFGISIASTIEFADGTSPGTAYIENVPGNRYAMKVVLALDDTGEAVYESKALKPGTFIEDIELSHDLGPGTYAATATFEALDPETLEKAGSAAARVSLIVRA